MIIMLTTGSWMCPESKSTPTWRWSTQGPRVPPLLAPHRRHHHPLRVVPQYCESGRLRSKALIALSAVSCTMLADEEAGRSDGCWPPAERRQGIMFDIFVCLICPDSSVRWHLCVLRVADCFLRDLFWGRGGGAFGPGVAPSDLVRYGMERPVAAVDGYPVCPRTREACY